MGDLIVNGRALRSVAALALLLSGAGSAWAQPAKPVAAAVPPAPVPSTPQQTTATFGNWVLRCFHPASGSQMCEVVQMVQQDGRTIAQMAIGSLAKDKPPRMTIVVQPNVGLTKKPSLAGPGKEGEDVSFTWERCLPGLCLADSEISDVTLQRIRGWTQPGRISYADASGREVEMPLSPTGLPQALDALAKEDGN